MIEAVGQPGQVASRHGASDTRPLLVVEDVHVAYAKKEVLRGASLTVYPGEIVALLGGNGSGKSTMLKTIAGLLEPSAGTVAYRGRNLAGLSVQGRQRLGIGFLLQGGRVFPNLTVAENLAIAGAHHRNGRVGRVAPGRVFPALAALGGRRAGLLSGGLRQMLAIEGVLAQEPELLLLDEPTAALSAGLAREILDSAVRYATVRKCGALLVEQNVTEAVKVSSRVLRLADGRAVSGPASLPEDGR